MSTSTPRAAGTPTPLWGEQTRLAIENFPISGQGMPMEVIRAIASIKAEAAAVNTAVGVLPVAYAVAIGDAAESIVRGDHDDQFPVDVFQTGSGTSSNMNVNEVIAHLAAQQTGIALHPNDHVNASQSSNDVVPSAIRLAVGQLLTIDLSPALVRLCSGLTDLAEQHLGTVKLGRTHLMDAVPMTFGQEVGGWARSVQLAVERVDGVWPRLGELPIGGTAVGTGVNAPVGFGSMVADRLRRRTGLPWSEATDHFEAQSTQDVLVEVSGVVRSVALTLHKIAGDLRLLGSGPVGGLAEVTVPTLQAGSSIMPGKVNPVIPEAVQQVTCQVVGNDAAVVFASTLSTLQLSTAMPVIARNLVESIRLLTGAASVLDTRCIRGIDVDAERMRSIVERSSAMATMLAPTIGYDRAAALVRSARERGVPLGQAARDAGIELGVDEVLRFTRPETRDGEH